MLIKNLLIFSFRRRFGRAKRERHCMIHEALTRNTRLRILELGFLSKGFLAQENRQIMEAAELRITNYSLDSLTSISWKLNLEAKLGGRLEIQNFRRRTEPVSFAAHPPLIRFLPLWSISLCRSNKPANWWLFECWLFVATIVRRAHNLLILKCALKLIVLSSFIKWAGQLVQAASRRPISGRRSWRAKDSLNFQVDHFKSEIGCAPFDGLHKTFLTREREREREREKERERETRLKEQLLKLLGLKLSRSDRFIGRSVDIGPCDKHTFLIHQAHNYEIKINWLSNKRKICLSR